MSACGCFMAGLAVIATPYAALRYSVDLSSTGMILVTVVTALYALVSFGFGVATKRWLEANVKTAISWSFVSFLAFLIIGSSAQSLLEFFNSAGFAPLICVAFISLLFVYCRTGLFRILGFRQQNGSRLVLPGTLSARSGRTSVSHRNRQT